MSKYTMELRELFTTIKFSPTLYTRSEVEGFFKDYELSDFLTQDQIDVIEEAGIWTKDKLAKKIVDHYYMSEIGFETIGLFIHFAKTTMNEIMEKYLPMIYSSSIEYDPLINVDFTETFDREATSTSNSASNNSSLAVYSDTPQGQTNKATILSGSYATSTTGTESDSGSSGATGANESYTKRTVGNSGVSATAQKMIELYRNNIIAIDSEIIKELNSLFMGLY